ncbi:transducin/WD40 repeat-like superfamily protein [Wolffia australiana]
MAAAGAWDFRLRSVVAPAAARQVSDAIGAMEFDPAGEFLATGGIARKIRVYRADPLLPEGEPAATLDHAAACSLCICAPAKLSSLRWKPSSRAVGAGDYDGVVTEYDLDRAVPVFERDEHGGRRVWSVDYSPALPHLGASASDDGTAQIWDARCGGAATAAVLRPAAAAVCSVEFDPSAAAPLVAAGCADKNAYVYDLRRAASPAAVFRGHRRSVTYVRFAGGGNMVSAGTDGCLRLWSLADARELRAFAGHRNCRSFVGLGVWQPGPLLACGSETNQVYVYDPRWPDPAWVGAFDAADSFVGSVCWRPHSGDSCALVAGASDGVLRVFSGRKN